jgi:prepilin-type N-terminal cleavage/methylation domain-containing protein
VRGAQAGFTLTELAVVVAIVALLVGGVLMTLAAQNNVREVRDTQRTLELARDALLGFAAANGRLPCPAPAPPAPTAAPGPFAVESFVDAVTPPPATDLRCAAAGGEGFLPAITLGIGPTDRHGYLLDAWGNPLRYAVSTALPIGSGGFLLASCPPNPVAPANPDFTRCPVFTTANAILSLGFAALPNTFANGLLRVCTEAACTGPQILTPAVVWSPGKNFTLGAPAGADEQANLTFGGDRTFVHHTPAPAGAPGGEFDDIVVSIPPAVLYNRLLAAGGV